MLVGVTTNDREAGMGEPKQSTNEALDRFDRRCRTDVAKLLTEFGFTHAEHKEAPLAVSHTFVSGERYVRLAVSFNPRDQPFVCLVSLGEGSRNLPEADWNAIPLVRVLPHDANLCVTLDGTESVDRAIDAILHGLAESALDFLKGDLARFNALRSDQNRERKPYRIYEPDPAGNYRYRLDPESERLKGRFS
jgi:hypothetical protein